MALNKIGEVRLEELLTLSQNTEWLYSSPDLNVDEMWTEFHDKLLEISSNVPIDNNRNGSNIAKKIPWDNSALKRRRREKDKQWAIFDACPSPMYLNKALSTQSEYEKNEIGAKIKYEKKITRNLKSNTKSFFSYLRSKRKLNTTVTALKKEDGTLSGGAAETKIR